MILQKRTGGFSLWCLTLLLYSFLGGEVFGLAQDSDVAQQNLKSSLSEMGYVEVHLEGCKVSFSRLVQPSQRNGGLHRYDRVIKLGTLNFDGEIDVRSTEAGGKTYYYFIAPPNEALSDLHHDAEVFRQWVNVKFPGVNWPDYFPAQHDFRTEAVEQFLHDQFPNFAKLNLWANFTKFGRSSLATIDFRMYSESKPKLERFKTALQAYSRQFEC
ncbi:hypothetical protein [Leisingera sp. ANG-M6]|uniref:hypothetical protein n=1 Tax=Leisingera sp. ANG-M6 TaxID=1577900 RepID=UPI000580945E|nr:hypothetical protein [Leisingera sp. ANG-M6]KIC30041.1 hypothetical protein RA24_03605 [Leisingera sp. ANG-M6]